MPAFIRTQQGSETHHQVDPACPQVVGFLSELIDEATPYAPLSLRLECFEATHLHNCERCRRFSRAFSEWLEKNRRDRMDAAIADERQFLRQLNGLD
jgi:predicted anti-sigma-YlaC factor YlaD